MQVVSNVVMKKINEIKPYIRNPRKNDKTVQLLVDIIPKVGFNVPIVIDEKGIIVKGHSRWAAAIKLGMKEVPCIISEADEEAIKLDRIADNRISEFSEWIGESLAHELDILTMDFSMLEFELPKMDEPAFEPALVPEIPSYEEYVKEYVEEFEADVEAEDEEDAEENAEENAEDEEALKAKEEARKAEYEAFVAQQEANRRAALEAQKAQVDIATQKELEKAYAKQAEVAQAPPRYFKLTCECCGHVQFVTENQIWESEER